MILPYFNSDDQTLSLLQTKWSAILNPILSAPTNQGVFIQNINLINGVNTINHGLGRVQLGWSIVDINGAASIYRSAPFNNLTLTLTSNAAVTVSIEVF